MTGQPGDDDFGIAYNSWDEGINPWDFGVESECWDSRYQGYLYTDRPIYRPGQTVYFKGILRADDDAHYSLPTDGQVGEGDGQRSAGQGAVQKEVSFSDMGTFFDELALDDEAPLGYYYVWFENQSLEINTGTSFQVAEYRVPEYQVTVTTDRDAYMSGDTIAVTAEATYYFGGPVANAAVHWSVLSDNYSFSYQCPAGQPCPWYDWTDYDWTSYAGQENMGYGGLLAEGDAETDAQGRVIFKVPADISDKRQSQIFTIEASVTDINGQQVSNRTGAIVHKGEFYIGARAAGLPGRGRPAEAVRPSDGRPGQPAGGRSGPYGDLVAASLVQRPPPGRGRSVLLGLDGRGDPGDDHHGDHRRRRQGSGHPHPKESRQLQGAGHRPRRAGERDPHRHLLLGVGRRRVRELAAGKQQPDHAHRRQERVRGGRHRRDPDPLALQRDGPGAGHDRARPPGAGRGPRAQGQQRGAARADHRRPCARHLCVGGHCPGRQSRRPTAWPASRWA